MHDTGKKLVIVGGGAGGLELAIYLGRKFADDKAINITLVDSNLTHLWKPLLHEVAAGTLDSNQDELNYISLAYANNFNFELGTMQGLNRSSKFIYLAPIYDQIGVEIIPERLLIYDILVMAIGSTTNNFSILGVNENCYFLDNRLQADNFHKHFLKLLMYIQANPHKIKPDEIQIGIVGGGATGVELAAELNYAIHQAILYTKKNITPNIYPKIFIIESSKQILANLPQRIIDSAKHFLDKNSIKVYESERVTQVTVQGFYTKNGLFLPSSLKVWAAGIKGPELLNNLDGLETNQINQLAVLSTLQTTRDKDIFALGDCAYCPLSDGKGFVPPRAQAAHQQAKLLARSLSGYLMGRKLLDYKYRDYGSLISLSSYTAVGSIMGLKRGRIILEGRLARWAYWLLYKVHQKVILGWWRVFLVSLANFLTLHSKPRVKFH